LNSAEGAARQTLADKSRAYGIALAECCECCAAIEIATALGACSPVDEQAVLALGLRLKNVLSRLVPTRPGWLKAREPASDRARLRP
jgi:four helix bundle protein